MTPEEWYRSLPPITKIYWTSVVAVSVVTSLGLVNPMLLALDWTLVGKFQVTCCCDSCCARVWTVLRAELESLLTWPSFSRCSSSLSLACIHQIWRLFTCFMFFGKFSMPTVFAIVLLSVHFEHTPARACCMQCCSPCSFLSCIPSHRKHSKSG